MIGLGSFSTCVLLVTLVAPTYTEGSGIVILGYGSRPRNQPTQATPEEVLAGRSPFGEIDSGLPENGPQSDGGNKPPPGPAPEAGPVPKPEAVPPQPSPVVPAPGGVPPGVQPGPGGVTAGVQPGPAQPNERPGVGRPGMGPATNDLGADFMGPSPFSFGGPGANVFSGFEFRGFNRRGPSGGRLPGLGSGVGPGRAPAGAQPGAMPGGPGGAVGSSGLQPSIGGPVPNRGEGGVGGEAPLSGGSPGGTGALPSPEGPAPGLGTIGAIPTGAGAGGGEGIPGGNENGGGGPGISGPPSRASSGSSAGLPGGPGFNIGGEAGRPGGSTSVGGGASSGNQPDLLTDPDFKEFEREMNDHIRESEDGFMRPGGRRENGGSILGGMPGAFGTEGGMTGGISGGSPGGITEGPGGGASEVAGRSGWGDFNFGGVGGGRIPPGFGGFSTAGGELGSGFGGGPSGENTGLEGPTEEGGATGGPGGHGGPGEPGGPGGDGGAPQPSAHGPIIREGGRSHETPSLRRQSTPMGSGGRQPQGTRRRGLRVLTLNRRQVRRILKEEGFSNKDIAYLLNPKLLLSTRGKGLAVVLARLANIRRGSPFHRTRRLLATRFIRRFLKTERGVRRVVISFRNRFRRSPAPVSSSLGPL